MLKIITKSGSIYEIDLENKKMRRNPGSNTANLDLDLEWADYEIFIPLEIKIGDTVQFFLKDDLLKKKDAFKVTSTSKVIKIIK